jgi:putative SOS response-associated peptidase YedK
MCGRYVTITKVQEIEKRFGVTATEPAAVQVRANVAPGQKAAVITDDAPDQLRFYHFGFTPSWASKRMYVINARSEGDHNLHNHRDYHGAMGIIQKPMFRSSIRKKRCLVVADAFIEGPQKEKLNKPYCVYPTNGERPFAFAGIWDEWVNKSTGEVINSFAIITTQANELMHRIGHHRSPVVLQAEEESIWLDQQADLQDITALLRPFPDDQFNAYPISPRIKSPQVDSLELLRPVGERVFPEYAYSLHQDLKLEGMGASTGRQRRLFED